MEHANLFEQFLELVLFFDTRILLHFTWPPVCVRLVLGIVGPCLRSFFVGGLWLSWKQQLADKPRAVIALLAHLGILQLVVVGFSLLKHLSVIPKLFFERAITDLLVRHIMNLMETWLHRCGLLLLNCANGCSSVFSAGARLSFFCLGSCVVFLCCACEMKAPGNQSCGLSSDLLLFTSPTSQPPASVAVKGNGWHFRAVLSIPL